MKRGILLTMLVLGMVTLCWAQDVEMADTFRKEGKIYVVIAIIVLLLLAIFFYLFSIERKIKKATKK